MGKCTVDGENRGNGSHEYTLHFDHKRNHNFKSFKNL